MGPHHQHNRTQCEICMAALPKAQQKIHCRTCQKHRKEHRKQDCRPTALQALEQEDSILHSAHGQLWQAHM